MARKIVHLGSIRGFHVYDDALGSSAIETDGLIKTTIAPTSPEDVVRLDDIGGGGPAAPSDASYIVVGLDGDLSNERQFIAGSGLIAVDGGANGNYTLSVDSGSVGSLIDINDINDVVITTPSDDDVLVYDIISGNWINQAGGSFADNQFKVFGNLDNTKLVNLNVDAGVATGTTRVLQVPNADGIIALTGQVDGSIKADDVVAGVFSGSSYKFTANGVSDITIENVDVGTLGGVLKFQHDSSSPADNDVIGKIIGRGKDSLGTMLDFGDISISSSDVTSGSRAGSFSCDLYMNNIKRNFLRMTGYDGASVDKGFVIINNDGRNIDTIISSVIDPFAFFLNGNTSQITTGSDVFVGRDLIVSGDISGDLNAGNLVAGIIPDLRIGQTGVTQHEAAINHNALLNHVANEHIDWTNATQNFLTTGEIRSHFHQTILSNTSLNGQTKIELGGLASGDRDTFIDFHGDDTYTDYGLRVWRNAGANGDSVLNHHGTGSLNLNAIDAGKVQVLTNSLTRMTVDSNGNVGIGTTTPKKELDLRGSLVFDATVGDKLSLYDDRIGQTNAYGFGIESSTLYSKAQTYHRWYINTNADAGVSAKMELSSGGLNIINDVHIGTKDTGGQSAALLHIQKNTTANPVGLMVSRRYLGSSNVRGSAFYHYYDTVGTKDWLCIGVAGDGVSGPNYADPLAFANAKFLISPNGEVGIGKAPSSALDINLSTEDLEIVNAGSTGATEQDWVEVKVGGVQGYIRIYATK